MRTETRPNLFDFDNYRRYLQAYYHYRKAANPGFSHRVFARKAGYRSSSFLKHVMDGKRNLTDTMIVNFAKALDLDAAETRFFRQLVRLNQARTVEDRQQIASQIMRSKTFRRLNSLSQSHFEYWSHWYNVAIRELVALPGFREDPEWIAAALRPQITPQEAARSLQILQELQLLRRDAQGRLCQVDRDVGSGDEVINASLAHFHKEMIRRAGEALDRFEREARQITAVTMSLNDEGEQIVRQMIHEFRKDLLAVSDRYSNPTRIVQINFQLFPLTNNVSERPSNSEGNA